MFTTAFQDHHFRHVRQVIHDWYDVLTNMTMPEHEVRRVWGATYAAALFDYNSDENNGWWSVVQSDWHHRSCYKHPFRYRLEAGQT